MLFEIDTDKAVTQIPYHKEFNIWRNRLTSEEFESIVDKPNSLKDDDEIHTAGWVPGNK